MRWLRDNLTRDGVVTTTDTWLVHQLCGAFVTDSSTASRSLLTRPRRGRVGPELVELFGLDGEELPEIVAERRRSSGTRPFGGSIPVTGLIVDQQAALLGRGLPCAGDGQVHVTAPARSCWPSSGTAAARSSAGLTTSVAWTLRDHTSYCVDGQVYTAASAVRWAIDLGLVPSADQLDAVAAAGSSDGVLCVPALAGLAAPWWDAKATASFTGMT